MPFVKLVKNKAYSKRFQTKNRRRREGKTDYAARRALVTQDKNKFASPKYRLVVRLTNHYVICQVVYSTIEGDKVMAAAYSSELPRYGLKVGLKNYSAAYATGLLVARRLLAKLNMADKYAGNEEIDGKTVKTSVTTEGGKTREFYVAEVDEERKPFRCYLDVGIRPTTTGARVFGAMKGAVDGGLDIPHSEKRFPGFIRETKKHQAEELKERIMMTHVSNYIEFLKEEDQEAYEKIFAKYIEEDLSNENIEEVIEGLHSAIRADPSPAPKKAYTADKSHKKAAKRTLEERKAAVAQKKAARAKQLASALGRSMDEDDE